MGDINAMTIFECDCGNKSFSIHYDEEGEWVEVICFNCNKHHPTRMETVLNNIKSYITDGERKVDRNPKGIAGMDMKKFQPEITGYSDELGNKLS